MKLHLLLLSLATALSAMAQTTREEVYADLNKAGGVYYAYPVTESVNTPAPKGYKPFYISHYGRHGSRYLISDRDYDAVLLPMREANIHGKLTPQGEEALALAERVWLEAEGRGGDLTPLGVRQHKGIARRMYKAFPEVFAGDAPVSARSTTVMRCALSMDAFCEALKEENPGLDITREASNRYMNYLNYHSPESNAYTGDRGPWREEYRKFERSHVNPGRLMTALFNDSAYVHKHVNPEALMWGLYWMAADQQNIETPGSFLGLFTPEEMFDMWQIVNYGFYVRDSNYPGNQGLVLGNTKALLRNIIESADSAIAQGGNSATLRFGHDGNLIPLAGMLQLKDTYNQEWDPAKFYTAFSDFKIAPMAGNIQMVFFRNPKKPDADILVKFMLNERETSIPVDTDIYPFYRWEDVRRFYAGKL